MILLYFSSNKLSCFRDILKRTCIEKYIQEIREVKSEKDKKKEVNNYSLVEKKKMKLESNRL